MINTIEDTKKDYQERTVRYDSKPVTAISTSAEMAIVQAGGDAIMSCLLSLTRLSFPV